jgi:tryptophan synthase alpha chain
MSRPIIKICGVTREEEIGHLAERGIEFFGLVLDVPSPWALSAERAGALAAKCRKNIRPTLVTRPLSSDKLASLIRQIGVAAIQLPALTPARHVRELRGTFSRDELVIIQEIAHRPGQFINEEKLDDYLAAGADFILLDKLDNTPAAEGTPATTIPDVELTAFRQRHAGRPILVAGGVTPGNAQAIVTASGAVGVDVCSSVRRAGIIQPDLVDRLLQGLGAGGSGSSCAAPSLCAMLKSAAPGNHVIGYLTIGDPPHRFVDVADEVLAAGALTLELGFPHPEPQEGPTLAASHRRALDAGVTTQESLVMLQTLARRHPRTPLVAVVQSPAMRDADDFGRFLDSLKLAGAAAVLPVGLSPWQLPALAATVHQRSLETVLACPPNASRKLREIIVRYCSGCVYVPRGRITGGAQPFANVADFCHLLARETDLPIIVGVGVQRAADVAEVCANGAVAAAVGSALVDHINRNGSAGALVRELLAQ